MGAVKDPEANATLTELNLYNNRVGDAGASALADASGRVFGVTANVASQSHLQSGRRQLVEKVYTCLCRRNCARFVLKLMWHSVIQKLDCLSSHRAGRTVALNMTRQPKTHS